MRSPQQIAEKGRSETRLSRSIGSSTKTPEALLEDRLCRALAFLA